MSERKGLQDGSETCWNDLKTVVLTERRGQRWLWVSVLLRTDSIKHNHNIEALSLFDARGSLLTAPCSLHSLQLQPSRPAVPLQHGALQTVREEERGGLPQLSAQHGRSSLPLLQGGLLPRPVQTHLPQEGLQRYGARFCPCVKIQIKKQIKHLCIFLN